MCAKLIITVALAIAAVSILLVARSSSPSVALTFSGYDTDGWAHFTLTNQTRFYLSHSHAHIQVRTSAGWTNYVGIESLMCRLIGPLPAHDGTTLLASLPNDCQQWRATVRYQFIPVYEPGWRATLESMLASMRLGPRTNETTLVTQEFVR